ncbi:hypothetical protein [Streptomyces sp. JB150]|uniref:hypothetical protein n=1 Tax=Streptomyces sp. JB150 TaxID=2714844 RepID=UPI00140A75B7|nr:hypothetical protein [Streptomyces sp. JB150]QIJ62943.1 hypothetical protein G7Z13_13520 [Streptomyces sp. JB150]
MNELARLRKAAGHTQESFISAFVEEAARMGVRASLSVRQLRRWERESPPPLPHPSQQRVLEAMFGVPIAEMGFDVPRHRLTISAPMSDPETVKRRIFVADVGALAATTLLPERPGPRVGTADVVRLRKKLDALYRMDHTVGSVPAMAQSLRIEEEITGALNAASYTSRVGRELQTLLAELHGHRAWYGYDGGRFEQGRTSCLEALTAAQLIGDSMLHISVLETLVLLALKAKRNWEAAGAVEHAHRLAMCAGAGPTVHLVIALREANVATGMRDLAGARRALSRAVNHLGRADTDHEVPKWARFVGPFEVDYATADMYVQAGQPKRAVPFLRAAVRGFGGDLARNSASYRAKLAAVLLDAGEVEEACAEMSTVLEACTGIRSPKLLGRIVAFQRMVSRIDSVEARACGVRIRQAVSEGLI